MHVHFQIWLACEHVAQFSCLAFGDLRVNTLAMTVTVAGVYVHQILGEYFRV